MELYKTITKDENWTSGKNNTTEEFKDKEGKIVLKRTYSNYNALNQTEIEHDTYYVYDQYGNLTYVIPPLANGSINLLDELCYQYKYDERNRLVEKKLPGKQWEFIVYNTQNMPVATGSAYNPWGATNEEDKGWLITKYDGFGRVIYTGYYTGREVTNSGRKSYQVEQDGIHFAETIFDNSIDNINVGYTNKVLPIVDFKLLTINYYDDYDFPNAPSTVTTLPTSTYPIAQIVKGLPTGSWIRILDDVSNTNAETSYTFYDNKYRPVRVNTSNYLGGFTQIDSNLDWSGKTLYTVTKHKYNNNATEITITDTFEYSGQDRLTLHKQQINSEPEQLITSNTYDELGQLISKKVGGEDLSLGLQTVDYSYNIRGWLKSINDTSDIVTDNDLFSFKINYNNPTNATPLFNGNISETYWKTNDNVLRKYNYSYDNLNRLLEANYSKPENASTPDYFLERLSYDKNGNIQTLFRNGDMDSNNMVPEVIIDNLVYTYNQQNPNQLEIVADLSGMPQGFKDDVDSNYDPDNSIDYTYDANGNMISDENKGITNIIYNHLNLPVEIEFGANGKITYLYNATGQKVSKHVENFVSSDDNITTYLSGGFQYKNTELQFFPHAEGYVNAALVEVTCITCRPAVITYTRSYDYVFNYTDHLGNIRVSYGVDPSTGGVKIMEQNHYYPFGLKHTNYNSDVLLYSKSSSGTGKLKFMPPAAVEPSYKYKYNGKELQDELGLNMYDYGARNYDPALGRWMNIDPLSENSRRWTPYNYAYNNPMYFVDPDGMQADDWVHVNGEMLYDSRVVDQASAEEHYGGNAAYYSNGTQYTSVQGDNIELGDLGFFKENGTLKTSADMSSTEGQIAMVNQSYAGLGLAIGGIGADVATPDPSDAVPQKWVGYGIAAIAGVALTAKRDIEINRILDRASDGPPGVQYSLRANTSGEYPTMTAGSSIPTGTMYLNAGDVWKYGETTNPASRYNSSDLGGIGAGGVSQYNEFSGTQIQIKAMEKAKIYSYFMVNGHLPAGNKIFR
jgi:RHS repeat-associated protein